MLWALIKGKVKVWLRGRALIVPEADLKRDVDGLLKALTKATHLDLSSPLLAGAATSWLREYNRTLAGRAANMVDKFKL